MLYYRHKRKAVNFMKKLNLIISLCVTSIVFFSPTVLAQNNDRGSAILPDATPSIDVKVSAGGGVWNYGVAAIGSYSNYNHPTKIHSATVQKGNRLDSQKKGAKYWAKASLFIFSGCEFFWNTY